MTVTRRFHLEGLDCACRIGAYDHERLGPQRVIIDAEIMLSGDTEPQRDSLEATLYSGDRDRAAFRSSGNAGAGDF